MGTVDVGKLRHRGKQARNPIRYNKVCFDLDNEEMRKLDFLVELRGKHNPRPQEAHNRSAVLRDIIEWLYAEATKKREYVEDEVPIPLEGSDW